MANAPRSLVNETVGQFQIKEELGRGGMAVVYKGYQPSLDRWVAIKTLPAESSADRELVARFHREAEAMVALNHSNIVQIIDKGQDKGLYYFAMEFVEGPSLKDLLKQETLSMDLMFDIAAQVCDGLGYAHKKGIVHRDIKPANILYEKSTGLAKVADFGIARKSDDLTLTTAGMGTMNYMAPEQREDARSVDHRADIYSLGVMIYEMFTGKLPIGRFKPASQLNPSLPRKLDEVVSKALETDPADRYQQMDELKADLQVAREASKGGTLVRSVRDLADRTLTAVAGDKPGGKGRLVACCLLFALLGLGGGGAFVVVDPMKIDLLAKVGLKSGGTTTEGPPTGTEKPPTTGTEKAPTTGTEKAPTTNTEKAPTTNTERPVATSTEKAPTTSTEKAPTTSTEKPPATSTEKPPATSTEKPPTTSTERPPTTSTEKPPATSTEKPPATSTEKPPATNTEKPPATSTEKPPVAATETETRPEVRRLNAAQLARFNDAARYVAEELTVYRNEARAAGLPAEFEATLTRAEQQLDEATRLKDQGDDASIERVEGALASLRKAVTDGFIKRVSDLVGAARAEGVGSGAVRAVESELDLVRGKKEPEQARLCSELVRRLHDLRVEHHRSQAELLLGLAEIRAGSAAVADLEAQLRRARALPPEGAADALAKLREPLLSLRGPTPEQLRFVAHKSVGDLGSDPERPFFISVCPAGGGQIAALGPELGRPVGRRLFICGVQGDQLVRRREVRVPLDGALRIAPAGRDAFWISGPRSRVIRYVLREGQLEQDREFTAPGDIHDLDTLPDGTLLVATLREVHQYRDGVNVGTTDVRSSFHDDDDQPPRQLTALAGGGWVLAGHAPDSPIAGLADVWAAEPEDVWSLTLRARLPAREGLVQLQPRDVKLSAVAACGDGFVAAQHKQRGGNLYFFGGDLESAGRPLFSVNAQSATDLAQDVAVSGQYVYVLDLYNATKYSNFRRRLKVYAIE